MSTNMSCSLQRNCNEVLTIQWMSNVCGLINASLDEMKTPWKGIRLLSLTESELPQVQIPSRWVRHGLEYMEFACHHLSFPSRFPHGISFSPIPRPYFHFYLFYHCCPSLSLHICKGNSYGVFRLLLWRNYMFTVLLPPWFQHSGVSLGLFLHLWKRLAAVPISRALESPSVPSTLNTSLCPSNLALYLDTH